MKATFTHHWYDGYRGAGSLLFDEHGYPLCRTPVREPFNACPPGYDTAATESYIQWGIKQMRAQQTDVAAVVCRHGNTPDRTPGCPTEFDPWEPDDLDRHYWREVLKHYHQAAMPFVPVLTSWQDPRWYRADYGNIATDPAAYAEAVAETRERISQFIRIVALTPGYVQWHDSAIFIFDAANTPVSSPETFWHDVMSDRPDIQLWGQPHPWTQDGIVVAKDRDGKPVDHPFSKIAWYSPLTPPIHTIAGWRDITKEPPVIADLMYIDDKFRCPIIDAITKQFRAIADLYPASQVIYPMLLRFNKHLLHKRLPEDIGRWSPAIIEGWEQEFQELWETLIEGLEIQSVSTVLNEVQEGQATLPVVGGFDHDEFLRRIHERLWP